MVQQFIRFFQEAYQELKLSTWLSRQQVMASTIVVMILTIIVAAYVGLIDYILLHVVGFLFRMR